MVLGKQELTRLDIKRTEMLNNTCKMAEFTGHTFHNLFHAPLYTKQAQKLATIATSHQWQAYNNNNIDFYLAHNHESISMRCCNHAPMASLSNTIKA